MYEDRLHLLLYKPGYYVSTQGFWKGPGEGTTKSTIAAHHYSKSDAGMIESNNDYVIAIPVMSNQARSITKSIRAGTFWVENPDG